MPTEIFRGRYTDEGIIMKELRKIFPSASLRVTPDRGRFLCTVPVRMSKAQRYIVEDAIEAEHYARDSL